jgi:hypothetical protein
MLWHLKSTGRQDGRTTCDSKKMKNLSASRSTQFMVERLQGNGSGECWTLEMST